MMKTALVLLVALTACIDSDLDQTEQAIDGTTRVRMVTISAGTTMSSVQTAPLSTTWTGLESVGGTDVRKLAIERNADGRLSLFAIGGDGALYARYQTSRGGGWNPEGWQSMSGGWIEQVITARNDDGRIEVFVRNTWGNVFHRYQVTPNGGWNPEGWLPFGGTGLRSISAATRSDGRLEVVAIGSDNHAYHRVQYVPNSGWDADWSIIGGSNLTTALIARGRLGMQIVALDTTNKVIGAQEDATGAWTGFSVIANKTMSQLVITTLSDGRLDLFGLTSGGSMYELMQDKITFAWNPFFNAPYYWELAQLAVATQADGSQVLFGRKANGIVYISTRQLSVWGSLLYFGGSAQTDVVAIDQE